MASPTPPTQHGPPRQADDATGNGAAGLAQPVSHALRLILYQPDIPQNTGTMMRMAACFGMGLDIIEPCGFILDDKRLRRAAMDYYDHLDHRRFASWSAFRNAKEDGRLIALTTKGATSYTDFSFRPDDRLLVGAESSGLPPDVLAEADARLRIPLRGPMRSLNVAIAAAIVSGEALRQIETLHT